LGNAILNASFTEAALINSMQEGAFGLLVSGSMQRLNPSFAASLILLSG
jgi:hypothetical protein